MRRRKLSAGARRLAATVSPYRVAIVVGVLLLLLTNAVSKSIPWFLRDGIDALVAGELGAVRWNALMVFALAAVMWLVRTLSRVQLFRVGRDVEFDLRRDLLASIHRQGTAVLDRFPTGDLLSRSIQDLGQVRLLVGFAFLNLVNAVFSYCGAITLMSVLSVRLTLLVLLPFPLFFLVARVFGVQLFRRGADAQARVAELATRAHEHISGARLVRSLGLAAHEQHVFARHNDAILRANMRIVALRGLLTPILSLLTSIAMLTAIWFGGEMVLEERLSTGDLSAFIAYLGQLVPPTLAFGWVLSIVQQGRAAASRVFDVIDATDIESSVRAALPQTVANGAATSSPSRDGEEILPAIRGDFELRQISFAYHSAGVAVFHALDLRISAGSFVAIVGRTGSGKSTLGKILAGQLDVSAGSVTLDDKMLGDIDPEVMRRNVLFSAQDNFLFSRSIRQNLRFGNQATDDEIERSLEEMCLAAEVRGLERGLDTEVGQRGVQLSGGQRQRITLARALLYRAPVLLLDDPLSAVDATTTESIAKVLARSRKGQTLIITTHQISLARYADYICVLADGGIEDTGRHDELLRRSPTYQLLAAEESAP